MYSLARSLLFRLDPEVAHRWVVFGIGLAGRIHPLNQYLADAWRGRSTPPRTRVMRGPFFRPGRADVWNNLNPFVSYT